LNASLALGLVDQAPLLDDVGEAVGHPRVGGHAVAARAAGLLVVAFDALRQVEVRDEAHVRLVDPHAERDRRDDDHAVVALEAGLRRRAVGRLHAGVVGQRVDALRREPRGGLVDLAARQAIDDAALARMLVAMNARSCARASSLSTIV
jgi:hypothetical protein